MIDTLLSLPVDFGEEGCDGYSGAVGPIAHTADTVSDGHNRVTTALRITSARNDGAVLVLLAHIPYLAGNRGRERSHTANPSHCGSTQEPCSQLTLDRRAIRGHMSFLSGHMVSESGEFSIGAFRMPKPCEQGLE
jgi:hypothetical protein